MISDSAGPLPPVIAYSRLLLRLDSLMRKGKGNWPEADSIREEMGGPWYGMTELEQERMRGLSEDLYTLADGGTNAIPMSPADRLQWAKEAKAALRDGTDPDLALAFLRRPFPQDAPSFAIPFYQSRFWEKLGNLDVALRFMREAERIDAELAICVLILLDKLGVKEEAEEYANRILSDQKSSPAGLFLASASLLNQTRHKSHAEAIPVFERILPELTRGLASAQKTSSADPEMAYVEVSIAFMLARCYEALGQVQKVLKVYDESITRHPDNEDLRAARDVALYDVDRSLVESRKQWPVKQDQINRIQAYLENNHLVGVAAAFTVDS